MTGSVSSYAYNGYISDFRDAVLKPVEPPRVFSPVCNASPYLSQSINTANAFIKKCQETPVEDGVDQLLKQKLDIFSDRSALIQTGLKSRTDLTASNLERLYEDLFLVSKWRSEVPFPQNYMADRTWMEFNRMELDIRSQIRSELNHTARDLQFMEKDLRESLLEYKIEHQKSKLLNLEDMVFNTESGGMEPEASYKWTGDLYPSSPTPNTQTPMVDTHHY